VIGSADDPFMLRWYVIPRNRFANVYVHKFLRPDDDRALHDHPWAFVSWLIKGEYLEYTDQPPNPHTRRRWSIAYRPAQFCHRVDLVNEYDRDGSSYGPRPAWTVIVTGPKIRDWGFWCKTTLLTIRGRHVVTDRFVPWQEFVDNDRGCGEP